MVTHQEFRLTSKVKFSSSIAARAELMLELRNKPRSVKSGFLLVTPTRLELVYTP